jgi:chemotaxis protein methyltransferase CheR
VRTRDLPELRRFVRSTERGYEVAPQIHEMVRFERVNLLDEAQVARFVQGGDGLDVIFCRNVIMYFDREARKRAIASFFEQLAPGGYLLLGHSESLLNLSTRFELVQLRNDTVYRKPPK